MYDHDQPGYTYISHAHGELIDVFYACSRDDAGARTKKLSS